MLGTDRVEAGDPLTDTLAVGDPPQAAKTSTPQSTSEKYLFMIPLRGETWPQSHHQVAKLLLRPGKAPSSVLDTPPPWERVLKEGITQQKRALPLPGCSSLTSCIE